MDFSASLNQSLKLEQRLSPLLLQNLQILFESDEELYKRIVDELEINPFLKIDPTSLIGRKSTNYSDSEENNWIENISVQNESLSEHLSKQADIEFTTKKDKFLFENILPYINPQGFLDISIEDLYYELLKKTHYVFSIEYLKSIIEKIKSFEPVGCGSSDLFEALKKQIDESDLDCKKELKNIVNLEAFELFEKKKFSVISKKCSVNADEVEELFKKLKLFEPYPGLKYSNEGTSFAKILFSIFPQNDGELKIEFTKSDIPDVFIDKKAVENASDDKNKETKKFVSENIARAKNLVSILMSRNQFIKDFAVLLSQRQKDVFLKGFAYLKPFTLTEAAEILDVSVSTISKFLSTYHIGTKFGVFSLRKFFSLSISNNVNKSNSNNKDSSDSTKSSNESLSQAAVIEVLKEIIEQSDSKMSDEALRKKLEEKGITISRRTVAKYRQKIGLNNSYKR